MVSDRPNGGEENTPDSVADDRRVDGIDVFISYGHSDLGIARQIRDYLEVGGYRCWIAPDDVTGPTTWAHQIVKAIRDCRVLLVLVSSDANGSEHVSKEVDLAVEYGKPLLPVRIEDVMPSGTLRYLLGLAQWIDAFPGPIEPHIGDVIRRLAALTSEKLAGTDSTPAEGTIDETHKSSPVTGPPGLPTTPQERRTRPWTRRLALGVASAALIGIGVSASLIISGNGDDETGTGDTTTTASVSSPEPSTETLTTDADTTVAVPTTSINDSDTTTSLIPEPLTMGVEVRLRSSSDWATLALADGAYWTEVEIIDASSDALVSVTEATVEIRQALSEANRGAVVEATVRLMSNDMDLDDEVRFEIWKGHIGSLYVVFIGRDSRGDPTYHAGHYTASGAPPSSTIPFKYRLPVESLANTIQTVPGGSKPPNPSADYPILATALQEVLVGGLNLGIDNPRPIFILDRVGVGEPSADGPKHVLTTWAQDHLRGELTGLGPVGFIGDSEEVTTDEPCSPVRDNGLVIRVWEVERDSTHAVFEVTEYTACLAGSGWRISLELTDSGWTVTEIQMTFVS